MSVRVDKSLRRGREKSGNYVSEGDIRRDVLFVARNSFMSRGEVKDLMRHGRYGSPAPYAALFIGLSGASFVGGGNMLEEIAPYMGDFALNVSSAVIPAGIPLIGVGISRLRKIFSDKYWSSFYNYGFVEARKNYLERKSRSERI